MVTQAGPQSQHLIKPSSVKKLIGSLTKLTEKFGQGKDVLSFTRGDALDYQSWVALQKVSAAYQRTLQRYAKQLFAFAVDHEWILSNPFIKLKSSSLAAENRHYVNEIDSEALINACPTIGWKVLIGLARYAGIRIPSEIPDSWNSIDWENRTITILAKKTKVRVCPIIPELFKILEEAYALKSTDKMVEISTCNLRRQFPKIIEKAGLAAWQDLFQTLRRSCATHLISDGFSQHNVAQWLGHSVKVSNEHYLMVRSEDFSKATGVKFNAKK